jgi:ribosome-associated toxin RatA of RatAB toxin-antitoxin module
VPEVSKTVLVPYTPDNMFRLVDDIARYPEFLPWCTGAEVLSREADVVRAALSVGFHGVKQRFATENHNTPPLEIRLKLIDGPFRSLDGVWRFNDLAGRGCKIEFNLAWTFSSLLLGTLVGPVFSHIADTMVEAFVKRAGKVYGER